MVVSKLENPKCRDCQHANDSPFESYVYCSWLNCRVWGASEMCDHGKDLLEIW